MLNYVEKTRGMTVMRQILKSIHNFFKTIFFCIKLSYKTSPKYFVLRILLSLISVVLPFTSIYFLSVIIDHISKTNQYNNDLYIFLPKFCFLIVFLILSNIFNKIILHLETYFQGIHSEIMECAIQTDIMTKSAKMNLCYFDSHEFFNNIRDAKNSIPIITATCFLVLQNIRYIVQFMISFVCFCFFDFILGMLLTFSSIVSIIFECRKSRSLYGFQKENLDDERKLNYLSDITISQNSAKEIKFFSFFPWLLEKYKHIWNDIFNKKKAIVRKYTILISVLLIIPEIILAFIILKLGLLAFSEIYTIGDFSYYQGIATQLITCLSMVIAISEQISNSTYRVISYIKFLNIKSTSNNSNCKFLKFNSKDFIIQFEHVSFKYDSSMPYVIKDLCMEINSKNKTAIVGTNGCGKTTIIKLILRLYDPTEGKILINGVDIRNYDVEDIRSYFSILFQDYCNYAFSIRESIYLADLKFKDDEEKILNSLKKSGSYNFVKNFQNKLDTYLTRQYSDKGEELSGGQWQSLALARAFFREASIYVLDEPSSSLDAESEDILFKKIDDLCKGKGMIIVSHRLSNIKKSDQILVIENGRLIESGSHSQLINLNGKYAHMFNLQAEKYT